MQIGHLNKRIILQCPTRTSDGMGSFTTVWAEDSKVWAAIWPTSAKEQIQSMKETLTVSHRIRIRYKSSVLSSWRVKFGSRYFNIVSLVNPEERNEWLDIMCKEAV